MYGERIKLLRKKAGLNQAQLALKIGVSRPNISFWENSAFPPLEAIDKVCKALNENIAHFFSSADEPSNIKIPEELKRLVQNILLFDDEAKTDLLDIFNNILQKYGRIRMSKIEGDFINYRNANTDMNNLQRLLKERESSAKRSEVHLSDVLFDPFSVRFYSN